MNKKILWILTFFIGTAMLALIGMQYYWIDNAIKVEEKQFSQNVNRILAYVSKEMEREEARSFILKELRQPLLPDTATKNNGAYYFDTIIQSGNSYLTYRQNITIHNNNIEGISYSTRIQGNSPTEQLITHDPIIQGFGFDTADLNQKYDKKLPEKLKEQYSDKRQFIDNIVNQMFSFDLDVEQRVDPDLLVKRIQNTFREKGYDIKFEYAVTRNYNEIAYKSEGFKLNESLDYYKVRLFQSDFFSKNNFLYVYFPKKNTFLFKNMGIMASSSIILTLTVVFSFILTMLIIFKQKKLSEIKNDFISNMTHELKTPISTISLATQMLSDKSIPTESKNIDSISNIISEESQRLGYQVERVLQMALFERGKLKLNMSQLDMHDIIESATRNFNIQIENKNGELINELQATNTALYADPVHMTNIVSNLLDNAIKYTPHEPLIKVSTSSDSKNFIFKVKDNGIGISKENQKRLFEKFYRVPSGNIHNVKGFGLGLSYVKMIVDALNGTISINSELNKGTEVKISLPLKNISHD